MWSLLLNDMRSPKVEMLMPAARATTCEELLDLLVAEKVEPYTDSPWRKTYRCGGPLEWFNPPEEFEEGHHFVSDQPYDGRDVLVMIPANDR